MAKTDGLGVRLYDNGYDISGDVSAISSLNSSQNLLDVTGLDKSAIERISALGDGHAAINSWFNPTAGQEHTALLTSGAVPRGDKGLLIPLGTAVGSACAFMVAKQASYNATRGNDGSLAVTADFDCNGFGLEFGVMLTALTRTDASATNGASVNNGGATAAGASAIVQVFSLSTGTVIPIIQDSANDSTFTAITGMTFAGVGTAGVHSSERLATTTTATIRQYVRLASTGTFTNAVLACGFNRG